MINEIISYNEMCSIVWKSLQRGMNYRINPSYSVILMSRKNNALYNDKILPDWLTIEYEWHDISKKEGDWF